MVWSELEIDGAVHDLTHLNAFTVRVPHGHGGKDIRVRVAFGCHCFTKEWDDGDDEALKYMDGKTPRCFCPQRYQHSHHLSDMVRQAVAGTAFFSTNRKYVFNAVLQGMPGPYLIAFKVERARNTKRYDVTMNVVSAHGRLRMPTLKPISFQKIVTLTATGQQIVWPK